jgi:hypothetical protein
MGIAKCAGVTTTTTTSIVAVRTTARWLLPFARRIPTEFAPIE